MKRNQSNVCLGPYQLLMVKRFCEQLTAKSHQLPSTIFKKKISMTGFRQYVLAIQVMVEVSVAHDDPVLQYYYFYISNNTLGRYFMRHSVLHILARSLKIAKLK